MIQKYMKWILIGAIVIIPAIIIIIWSISISNNEVDLRNNFNQKITERTTVYDNKIFKTVAGKVQITLRADTSFQNVVNAQMNGQKDAPGLFMKWITQSNPAATWASVQELYKDLSRTVEAVRSEFVEIEKTLQDIKFQHDNLRRKFPSSIVIGRRKELVYKPITSDRTDDVIRTGKDNNVKVF